MFIQRADYSAYQFNTTRKTEAISQTPTIQTNTQDLQDSASISELGQRLSRTMKKRLTGGASGVQKAASLMSKSLSEFESTLEKMNELTQKASKENLTALDRINMQIEFEALREDLAGASAKLNENFAKMSGKKPDLENLIDLDEIQPDTKNVLERARDRILNGQDWNIAESSEKNAPTVREKIRASGTVDLMSSVSSKKGIERIQNQLEDVKKMRENFSSFLMSYDGQDLEGGIKLSDLPDDLQRNRFQTVLGIMYKDGGSYSLERPANKMGMMFVKIDDLFKSVAGKIAGSFIED